MKHPRSTVQLATALHLALITVMAITLAVAVTTTDLMAEAFSVGDLVGNGIWWS